MWKVCIGFVIHTKGFLPPVPKGAISALSESLRHKCDDKYTIFGCENMTLEVIYLPNGSWKFSNFVGTSSAVKKELIVHFLAFFS